MTNNNLMDIEESLSSKVNDSKILYDLEDKNISLSDYDAQTKSKMNQNLVNEMEKIYDKKFEDSLKNENCSNISFQNNTDNSNNCFMSIEIKMKEILRNENPKDKAFYDDSEINKGSLSQDEPLKEKLMDDINDNDTNNIQKIINNNKLYFLSSFSYSFLFLFGFFFEFLFLFYSVYILNFRYDNFLPLNSFYY